MATYARAYKPCLGKMIDASPPVVWHCPVAGSEGFVVGDLVYRSGGYLTVCATTIATEILGIAKEDEPAAAGEVAVLVLTGMTAFKIPVHHATPGDAVIVVTDHGNITYDLELVASPYWYINIGASTTHIVTIQQFIEPIGTANGLVLATINAEKREVG